MSGGESCFVFMYGKTVGEYYRQLWRKSLFSLYV